MAAQMPPGSADDVWHVDNYRLPLPEIRLVEWRGLYSELEQAVRETLSARVRLWHYGKDPRWQILNLALSTPLPRQTHLINGIRSQRSDRGDFTAAQNCQSSSYPLSFL